MEAKPFPFVQVPAMLTGEAAAEYAAGHFWNRYFDSTEVWMAETADTLIGGVTRQGMTDAVRQYLMTLWSVSYGKAIETQKNLMQMAEASLAADTSGTIYGFLTEAMESALWNPLSDLRNEGFYIPVVESIMKTGRTGDHDISYYSRQAAVCLNNRPGTPAADFTFTDAHGDLHSLYGTSGQYILLLFSNPGCPACREIIAMLKDSPLITGMTEEGRLTMLSIYIDEDLAGWYRGLADYPDGWITGYNQDLSIRDAMTYDVRAIPSLYLLDSDRKVIFKDISPSMLMHQFREHGIDGYRY